jgi:hypothetical protein
VRNYPGGQHAGHTRGTGYGSGYFHTGTAIGVVNGHELWIDIRGTHKTKRGLTIMRTCRSRTFATIAVLAAFPVTARAQTPTDPLKLTLMCEQASTSTLAFRLTLQNVSPEPSRAIIGTMHGRFFEVSSLAFAVSRAGAADTDFDYLDPSSPGPAHDANVWNSEP